MSNEEQTVSTVEVPAPASIHALAPAEVVLPEVNRLRLEVVGVELASRRAMTQEAKAKAQAAVDALARLDLDYRRDRQRLEQEAMGAKQALAQAQTAESQIDSHFGVVFSGQMRDLGIPDNLIPRYKIDVTPSMRISRVYDPSRAQ